MRRVPAGWRMIEPGMYSDGDGSMHFFPGEYLAAKGIPDNEHNRRMIEEALQASLPGVPVFHVCNN